MNKASAGILAWVLKDRSAKTFEPLWNIIKCWHCFFYVTDGYCVYPIFINDADRRSSSKKMGEVSSPLIELWVLRDIVINLPHFFLLIRHQIINKTYMTRVEGENSRLRHYLARLHRKTFCYSKSEEMLRLSIRLLLHYLKYWAIPALA